MREFLPPISAAKRRLLDASEQLFAAHGFDAVSVRDVTQLAKANVAAVNYHFGSRNGLVSLVITNYLPGIFEERIARLDVLEKKWPGKAVPVEELLEAFVRPLSTAVKKSELPEQLCWCLLGRMVALRADELPRDLDEQSKILIERFNKALARTLGSLSSEEIGWRMHFVAGALIQTLTQPNPPGSGTTVTMEATLTRFIRFAIAGLRDGMEVEPLAKKGPQATFDF